MRRLIFFLPIMLALCTNKAVRKVSEFSADDFSNLYNSEINDFVNNKFFGIYRFSQLPPKDTLFNLSDSAKLKFIHSGVEGDVKFYNDTSDIKLDFFWQFKY